MSQAMTRKISIALLVVLMFTALFGWTSAAKPFKRNRGLAEMLGTSKDDIEDTLIDLEDDVDFYKQRLKNEDGDYDKEQLEEYREYLSVAKSMLHAAKVTFRTIKDYMISPVEIAPVLGALAAIDKADELDLDVSGLGFYCFMAWLVLLFFVFSVAYALYRMVRLGRDAGFLHIIATAVYFVLFIVVTVKVNGVVEDELGGYFSLKLLRLTAWPFIAMLCAIGSSLLCKLEPSRSYYPTPGPGLDSFSFFVQNLLMRCKQIFSNLGGKVSSGVSTMGVWVCPNCGNQCAGSAAFCINCGLRKPVPKRCGNCGSALSENARFCPRCGSRAPGGWQ